MSEKTDRKNTGKMNREERKIAETTGKFTMAIQDGQQVDQISWLEGRILVSNQRLILVGDNGRLAVEFSDITGLSGHEDYDRSLTALSQYMRIELNNDTVVVVPKDYASFREQFYTASLDGDTVRCKHPAVSGGVVQDVTWQSARLGIDTDQLIVTLNDGTRATLELDEITDSTITRQVISGAERKVICVSHSDNNTMIETHIAVPQRTCMFAQSLLKQGEQRTQTDIDLTRTEQEVLLALHSGVDSFDIPEFIGTDVQTAEETFDRLREYGVIDRVRTRQEVELNSSGRNIVSESLTERE